WRHAGAGGGCFDDIVNTYNSNLTFKQLPHLFRNDRGERFVESSKATGLDFRIVGRGAAYADIDNDGDLDIGIVDNGGKFRLLRNEGGNQNRWIRVRVQGTRSNRDGIGAVVSVRAGGIVQRQIVRSGGSFLSESQRELTFGLGAASKADAIEVRWPDGTVEKLPGVDAGRLVRITEGKGMETP
ncbi:MAG: ASPIC/UnbV domain-containing protein, partial [Armatimonadaceae bacterium]